MDEVALGRGGMVCYRVVLMALLVFVRSFRYISMKVCAAARVRCCGAGFRGAGLGVGVCLPLVLDNSALAVVSSSMASITDV